MTQATLSSTNKPLKQPRGLYFLFFTELWERYGFYTVQALLVLFLTQQFLLSDDKAYSIFGAYGALIYGTPVIGGYLADKFLGFRRAIYLGGTLFIAGYALLAVLDKGVWFYLALALLICGNGFFKSNVSSLLGCFYEEDDIRRDSGFTLFYMGINAGSLLATVFGVMIATAFGWQVAFGIAALGMLFGTIIFVTAKKAIGIHGDPPNELLFTQKILGISKINWVYLGTLVSIVGAAILLAFSPVVEWGLLIFGLITIGYVLATSIRLDKVAAQKLIALLVLILFSIVFWALYYQTFSSVILFIERIVRRDIGGYTIPPSMFLSIGPIVIILFSPLLSWLWLKLAKSNMSFSAPTKFALGILQMSLGFLILTLAVKFDSDMGKIAAGWLVLMFFVQTMGELFLSPMGLAVVTQLAPKDLTGMMMGVWFLSLAGANAAAGWIAGFTSIPKTVTDPAIISLHYTHAYTFFGLIGIGFAGLLMLLTPWLKKMIGENNN